MRYRDRLPQLDGDLFLTDGGIETTLIFHEGIELPAFAAFDLLKDDAGTETLRRYYAPYVGLARERGEAIGVARAAREAGMPVAISFTVETDGRLPSGASLQEAIGQVDDATSSAPAYYMINCAHPNHFEQVLDTGDPRLTRIRGLRANASARSHAELDEATELDEGDPVDLGARHAALRARLPAVNVLGGCCGTDHRHVGAICSAWLDATPATGA